MNRNLTPFQKSVALVLITALVAMTVSPAFAVENLYVSNSELNFVAWIDAFDLGFANTTFGMHSFTGNDEYLSRFTIYVRNDSVSESGTIRGVLFNVTETASYSWKPSNAAVPVKYSNNTIDVSSITTAGLIQFTFDIDFLLVSGTTYCLGVESATPLGTAIEFGRSASGGWWSDSQGDRTWTTNTFGLLYYVYTDDELGGGAPYTPPGGADLTSWDATISSFTSFIVPLIVLLLPAFLLCFITRRVDKWLLIIGITIGAGLGYYFNLVPLWLVFLVTIGLIGMAYQSVRGGGNS